MIEKVIEIVLKAQRRQRNGCKIIHHKTLRQAIVYNLRHEFLFTKLKCATCKQYLRPAEFHKDSSRASGKRPYCIQCEKPRRQEEYWRDPEHKRRLKNQSYARKKAKQCA